MKYLQEDLTSRSLASLILLPVVLLLLVLPVQAEEKQRKPPTKQIERGEVNPKLETPLQVLSNKWSRSSSAGMNYAKLRNIPLKRGLVSVIIEPLESGSRSIDEAKLKEFGAESITTSKSLISAKLPAGRLKVIANGVEGLGFIRLPHPFRAMKVDTSGGVEKTGADLYHYSGYYGQETKIAIVDVGFDGLTEAKDSGDIEPSIIAYTRDYTGEGLERGSSHGTNVAEIVHDMAPQAQLYLMKVASTVGLENAAAEAIDRNLDVINHSVGWWNSNFYDGTGPDDWGTPGTNSADVASWARDNGIFWVNSAGNQAQGHWQGEWYDPDGDNWLEFTSDTENNFIASVSEGSLIDIYMTWDAWPSDPEDYDLCLDKKIDDSWYYSVSCSSNSQTGDQPPREKVSYSVPVGEGGEYYFSIAENSAPGHPALDVFVLVDAQAAINGQNKPYSSVVTPSNSADVMTVGAINESNWTAGPAAYYSSRGPSNDSKWAFPRTKPDIMGPDCVSTSVYGRFCGTSASSPHVAGAAGLLLSQDSSRTPDDLRRILETNAVDMGPLGNDDTYGWGRMELPVPETAAVFRVTKGGDVLADKVFYGEAFETTNADLAEKVKVTGNVDPGDVLALNPGDPESYRVSQKPYSSLAMGVVSTNPGMTLGNRSLKSGATLALVGTVPVKVTTENGPIRTGDLLTTSSKAGYAMACNDRRKCSGAIIGKALEALVSGEGKIRVLLVG